MLRALLERLPFRADNSDDGAEGDGAPGRGGGAHAPGASDPLTDGAGKPYAICGVSTDITGPTSAEEARRTSEEKYRSLYDSTPVMMHSIDRDGRLVSVSNRWLATLGYERAEVIGRRSVEFLTPQSRVFAEQTVLPEFFRTGQCTDIHYQFVKKTGEAIDVMLSAIGERDAEGKVVRSVAVLIDVSERLRAEETLRESEQRFRGFAETASDWLWETGPDHRFTFVSAPSKVLEADRAARLGIRRMDVADDLAEEPEKWRQHVATLERREPFQNFVYRTRRTGGIVGYVLTSGKPRFGADGQFLGYRGTARDITNAVRADEALHASEQRFRDFAEVESDWFWETEPDHSMSWITGRSGAGGIVPGNRMGRRLWEYATDVEDEPEKWRQHREILERREPFRDFVFKITNLAGDDRYVSTSGKPVFAPDGSFAGYRGVGRDVTDAVRAERDLREGEERLELAIEAGNMGTWDYDIQRSTVQWSPQLVQLFGLPQHRTTANFDASMAHIHPDDRDRVSKALAAAIETRARYREEFRIASGDGERWVASHGIVVSDRAGKPVRMVGVVQDISARRRAESRQKLLLDELNHRVKNTLLTVQSVAMQMAREGGSPELFYPAFKARLIALSNAHDLLTRRAWQGARCHRRPRDLAEAERRGRLGDGVPGASDQRRQARRPVGAGRPHRGRMARWAA
jgi:PAS domain S-box-containing protein